MAAGILGYKNKNITCGTQGLDIHLDVKYGDIVKYPEYKFP